MQFGSDLSSCPNKAGRVRVIIRVRLENMGPGIPDNDKHPNKAGRVRVIIRVRLENMGPGIPENDKHPSRLCQINRVKHCFDNSTLILIISVLVIITNGKKR